MSYFEDDNDLDLDVHLNLDQLEQDPDLTLFTDPAGFLDTRPTRSPFPNSAQPHHTNLGGGMAFDFNDLDLFSNDNHQNQPHYDNNPVYRDPYDVKSPKEVNYNPTDPAEDEEVIFLSLLNLIRFSDVVKVIRNVVAEKTKARKCAILAAFFHQHLHRFYQAMESKNFHDTHVPDMEFIFNMIFPELNSAKYGLKEVKLASIINEIGRTSAISPKTNGQFDVQIITQYDKLQVPNQHTSYDDLRLYHLQHYLKFLENSTEYGDKKNIFRAIMRGGSMNNVIEPIFKRDVQNNSMIYEKLHLKTNPMKGMLGPEFAVFCNIILHKNHTGFSLSIDTFFQHVFYQYLSLPQVPKLYKYKTFNTQDHIMYFYGSMTSRDPSVQENLRLAVLGNNHISTTHSPFPPMLAKSIHAHHISKEQYSHSIPPESFIMQDKYDGERLLLHLLPRDAERQEQKKKSKLSSPNASPLSDLHKRLPDNDLPDFKLFSRHAIESMYTYRSHFESNLLPFFNGIHNTIFDGELVGYNLASKRYHSVYHNRTISFNLPANHSQVQTHQEIDQKRDHHQTAKKFEFTNYKEMAEAKGRGKYNTDGELDVHKDFGVKNEVTNEETSTTTSSRPRKRRMVEEDLGQMFDPYGFKEIIPGLGNDKKEVHFGDNFQDLFYSGENNSPDIDDSDGDYGDEDDDNDLFIDDDDEEGDKYRDNRHDIIVSSKSLNNTNKFDVSDKIKVNALQNTIDTDLALQDHLFDILVYRVFDIIFYNGVDLTSLSYTERRLILLTLLGNREYFPFLTVCTDTLILQPNDTQLNPNSSGPSNLYTNITPHIKHYSNIFHSIVSKYNTADMNLNNYWTLKNFVQQGISLPPMPEVQSTSAKNAFIHTKHPSFFHNYCLLHASHNGHECSHCYGVCVYCQTSALESFTDTLMTHTNIKQRIKFKNDPTNNDNKQNQIMYQVESNPHPAPHSEKKNFLRFVALPHKRDFIQQRLNCALVRGLEGVMVKRLHDMYISDSRSHWAKIKPYETLDLVVFGASNTTKHARNNTKSKFLLGSLDLDVSIQVQYCKYLWKFYNLHVLTDSPKKDDDGMFPVSEASLEMIQSFREFSGPYYANPKLLEDDCVRIRYVCSVSSGFNQETLNIINHFLDKSDNLISIEDYTNPEYQNIVSGRGSSHDNINNNKNNINTKQNQQNRNHSLKPPKIYIPYLVGGYKKFYTHVLRDPITNPLILQIQVTSFTNTCSCGAVTSIPYQFQRVRDFFNTHHANVLRDDSLILKPRDIASNRYIPRAYAVKACVTTPIALPNLAVDSNCPDSMGKYNHNLKNVKEMSRFLSNNPNRSLITIDSHGYYVHQRVAMVPQGSTITYCQVALREPRFDAIRKKKITDIETSIGLNEKYLLQRKRINGNMVKDFEKSDGNNNDNKMSLNDPKQFKNTGNIVNTVGNVTILPQRFQQRDVHLLEWTKDEFLHKIFCLKDGRPTRGNRDAAPGRENTVIFDSKYVSDMFIAYMALYKRITNPQIDPRSANICNLALARTKQEMGINPPLDLKSHNITNTYQNIAKVPQKNLKLQKTPAYLQNQFDEENYEDFMKKLFDKETELRKKNLAEKMLLEAHNGENVENTIHNSRNLPNFGKDNKIDVNTSLTASLQLDTCDLPLKDPLIAPQTTTIQQIQQNHKVHNSFEILDLSSPTISHLTELDHKSAQVPQKFSQRIDNLPTLVQHITITPALSPHLHSDPSSVHNLNAVLPTVNDKQIAQFQKLDKNNILDLKKNSQNVPNWMIDGDETRSESENLCVNAATSKNIKILQNTSKTIQKTDKNAKEGDNHENYCKNDDFMKDSPICDPFASENSEVGQSVGEDIMMVMNDSKLHRNFDNNLDIPDNSVDFNNNNEHDELIDIYHNTDPFSDNLHDGFNHENGEKNGPRTIEKQHDFDDFHDNFGSLPREDLYDSQLSRTVEHVNRMREQYMTGIESQMKKNGLFSKQSLKIDNVPQNSNEKKSQNPPEIQYFKHKNVTSFNNTAIIAPIDAPVDAAVDDDDDADLFSLRHDIDDEMSKTSTPIKRKSSVFLNYIKKSQVASLAMSQAIHHSLFDAYPNISENEPDLGKMGQTDKKSDDNNKKIHELNSDVDMEDYTAVNSTLFGKKRARTKQIAKNASKINTNPISTYSSQINDSLLTDNNQNSDDDFLIKKIVPKLSTVPLKHSSQSIKSMLESDSDDNTSSFLYNTPITEVIIKNVPKMIKTPQKSIKINKNDEKLSNTRHNTYISSQLSFSHTRNRTTAPSTLTLLQSTSDSDVSSNSPQISNQSKQSAKMFEQSQKSQQISQKSRLFQMLQDDISSDDDAHVINTNSHDATRHGKTSNTRSAMFSSNIHEKRLNNDHYVGTDNSDLGRYDTRLLAFTTTSTAARSTNLSSMRSIVINNDNLGYDLAEGDEFNNNFMESLRADEIMMDSLSAISQNDNNNGEISPFQGLENEPITKLDKDGDLSDSSLTEELPLHSSNESDKKNQKNFQINTKNDKNGTNGSDSDDLPPLVLKRKRLNQSVFDEGQNEPTGVLSDGFYSNPPQIPNLSKTDQLEDTDEFSEQFDTSDTPKKDDIISKHTVSRPQPPPVGINPRLSYNFDTDDSDNDDGDDDDPIGTKKPKTIVRKRQKAKTTLGLGKKTGVRRFELSTDDESNSAKFDDSSDISENSPKSRKLKLSPKIESSKKSTKDEQNIKKETCDSNLADDNALFADVTPQFGGLALPIVGETKGSRLLRKTRMPPRAINIKNFPTTSKSTPKGGIFASNTRFSYILDTFDEDQSNLFNIDPTCPIRWIEFFSDVFAEFGYSIDPAVLGPITGFDTTITLNSKKILTNSVKKEEISDFDDIIDTDPTENTNEMRYKPSPTTPNFLMPPKTRRGPIKDKQKHANILSMLNNTTNDDHSDADNDDNSWKDVVLPDYSLLESYSPPTPFSHNTPSKSIVSVKSDPNQFGTPMKNGQNSTKNNISPSPLKQLQFSVKNDCYTPSSRTNTSINQSNPPSSQQQSKSLITTTLRALEKFNLIKFYANSRQINGNRSFEQIIQESLIRMQQSHLRAPILGPPTTQNINSTRFSPNFFIIPPEVRNNYKLTTLLRGIVFYIDPSASHSVFLPPGVNIATKSDSTPQSYESRTNMGAMDDFDAIMADTDANGLFGGHHRGRQTRTVCTVDRSICGYDNSIATLGLLQHIIDIKLSQTLAQAAERGINQGMVTIRKESKVRSGKSVKKQDQMLQLQADQFSNEATMIYSDIIAQTQRFSPSKKDSGIILNHLDSAGDLDIFALFQPDYDAILAQYNTRLSSRTGIILPLFNYSTFSLNPSKNVKNNGQINHLVHINQSQLPDLSLSSALMGLGAGNSALDDLFQVSSVLTSTLGETQWDDESMTSSGDLMTDYPVSHQNMKKEVNNESEVFSSTKFASKLSTIDDMIINYENRIINAIFTPFLMKYNQLYLKNEKMLKSSQTSKTSSLSSSYFSDFLALNFIKHKQTNNIHSAVNLIQPHMGNVIQQSTEYLISSTMSVSIIPNSTTNTTSVSSLKPTLVPQHIDETCEIMLNDPNLFENDIISEFSLQRIINNVFSTLQTTLISYQRVKQNKYDSDFVFSSVKTHLSDMKTPQKARFPIDIDDNGHNELENGKKSLKMGDGEVQSAGTYSDRVATANDQFNSLYSGKTPQKPHLVLGSANSNVLDRAVHFTTTATVKHITPAKNQTTFPPSTFNDNTTNTIVQGNHPQNSENIHKSAKNQVNVPMLVQSSKEMFSLSHLTQDDISSLIHRHRLEQESQSLQQQHDALCRVQQGDEEEIHALRAQQKEIHEKLASTTPKQYKNYKLSAWNPTNVNLADLIEYCGGTVIKHLPYCVLSDSKQNKPAKDYVNFYLKRQNYDNFKRYMRASHSSDQNTVLPCDYEEIPINTQISLENEKYQSDDLNPINNSPIIVIANDVKSQSVINAIQSHPSWFTTTKSLLFNQLPQTSGHSAQFTINQSLFPKSVLMTELMVVKPQWIIECISRGTISTAYGDNLNLFSSLFFPSLQNSSVPANIAHTSSSFGTQPSNYIIHPAYIVYSSLPQHNIDFTRLFLSKHSTDHNTVSNQPNISKAPQVLLNTALENTFSPSIKSEINANSLPTPPSRNNDSTLPNSSIYHSNETIFSQIKQKIEQILTLTCQLTLMYPADIPGDNSSIQRTSSNSSNNPTLPQSGPSTLIRNTKLKLRLERSSSLKTSSKLRKNISNTSVNSQNSQNSQNQDIYPKQEMIDEDETFLELMKKPSISIPYATPLQRRRSFGSTLAPTSSQTLSTLSSYMSLKRNVTKNGAEQTTTALTTNNSVKYAGYNVVNHFYPGNNALDIKKNTFIGKSIKKGKNQQNSSILTSHLVNDICNIIVQPEILDFHYNNVFNQTYKYYFPLYNNIEEIQKIHLNSRLLLQSNYTLEYNIYNTPSFDIFVGPNNQSTVLLMEQQYQQQKKMGLDVIGTSDSGKFVSPSDGNIIQIPVQLPKGSYNPKKINNHYETVINSYDDMNQYNIAVSDLLSSNHDHGGSLDHFLPRHSLEQTNRHHTTFIISTQHCDNSLLRLTSRYNYNLNLIIYYYSLLYQNYYFSQILHSAEEKAKNARDSMSAKNLHKDRNINSILQNKQQWLLKQGIQTPNTADFIIFMYNHYIPKNTSFYIPNTIHSVAMNNIIYRNDELYNNYKVNLIKSNNNNLRDVIAAKNQKIAENRPKTELFPTFTASDQVENSIVVDGLTLLDKYYNYYVTCYTKNSLNKIIHHYTKQNMNYVMFKPILHISPYIHTFMSILIKYKNKINILSYLQSIFLYINGSSHLNPSIDQGSVANSGNIFAHSASPHLDQQHAFSQGLISLLSQQQSILSQQYSSTSISSDDSMPFTAPNAFKNPFTAPGSINDGPDISFDLHYSFFPLFHLFQQLQTTSSYFDHLVLFFSTQFTTSTLFVSNAQHDHSGVCPFITTYTIPEPFTGQLHEKAPINADRDNVQQDEPTTNPRSPKKEKKKIDQPTSPGKKLKKTATGPGLTRTQTKGVQLRNRRFLPETDKRDSDDSLLDMSSDDDYHLKLKRKTKKAVPKTGQKSKASASPEAKRNRNITMIDDSDCDSEGLFSDDVKGEDIKDSDELFSDQEYNEGKTRKSNNTHEDSYSHQCYRKPAILSTFQHINSFRTYTSQVYIALNTQLTTMTNYYDFIVSNIPSNTVQHPPIYPYTVLMGNNDDQDDIIKRNDSDVTMKLPKDSAPRSILKSRATSPIQQVLGATSITNSTFSMDDHTITQQQTAEAFIFDDVIDTPLNIIINDIMSPQFSQHNDQFDQTSNLPMKNEKLQELTIDIITKSTDSGKYFTNNTLSRVRGSVTSYPNDIKVEMVDTSEENTNRSVIVMDSTTSIEKIMTNSIYTLHYQTAVSLLNTIHILQHLMIMYKYYVNIAIYLLNAQHINGYYSLLSKFAPFFVHSCTSSLSIAGAGMIPEQQVKIDCPCIIFSNLTYFSFILLLLFDIALHSFTIPSKFQNIHVGSALVPKKPSLLHDRKQSSSYGNNTAVDLYYLYPIQPYMQYNLSEYSLFIKRSMVAASDYDNEQEKQALSGRIHSLSPYIHSNACNIGIMKYNLHYLMYPLHCLQTFMVKQSVLYYFEYLYKDTVQYQFFEDYIKNNIAGRPEDRIIYDYNSLIVEQTLKNTTIFPFDFINITPLLHSIHNLCYYRSNEHDSVAYTPNFIEIYTEPTQDGVGVDESIIPLLPSSPNPATTLVKTRYLDNYLFKPKKTYYFECNIRYLLSSNLMYKILRAQNGVNTTGSVMIEGYSPLMNNILLYNQHMINIGYRIYTVNNKLKTNNHINMNHIISAIHTNAITRLSCSSNGHGHNNNINVIETLFKLVKEGGNANSPNIFASMDLLQYLKYNFFNMQPYELYYYDNATKSTFAINSSQYQWLYSKYTKLVEQKDKSTIFSQSNQSGSIGQYNLLDDSDLDDEEIVSELAAKSVSNININMDSFDDDDLDPFHKTTQNAELVQFRSSMSSSSHLDPFQQLSSSSDRITHYKPHYIEFVTSNVNNNHNYSDTNYIDALIKYQSSLKGCGMMNNIPNFSRKYNELYSAIGEIQVLHIMDALYQYYYTFYMQHYSLSLQFINNTHQHQHDINPNHFASNMQLPNSSSNNTHLINNNLQKHLFANNTASNNQFNSNSTMNFNSMPISQTANTIIKTMLQIPTYQNTFSTLTINQTLFDPTFYTFILENNSRFQSIEDNTPNKSKTKQIRNIENTNKSFLTAANTSITNKTGINIVHDVHNLVSYSPYLNFFTTFNLLLIMTQNQVNTALSRDPHGYLVQMLNLFTTTTSNNQLFAPKMFQQQFFKLLAFTSKNGLNDSVFRMFYCQKFNTVYKTTMLDRLIRHTLNNTNLSPYPQSQVKTTTSSILLTLQLCFTYAQQFLTSLQWERPIQLSSSAIHDTSESSPALDTLLTAATPLSSNPRIVHPIQSQQTLSLFSFLSATASPKQLITSVPGVTNAGNNPLLSALIAPQNTLNLSKLAQGQSLVYFIDMLLQGVSLTQVCVEYQSSFSTASNPDIRSDYVPLRGWEVPLPHDMNGNTKFALSPNSIDQRSFSPYDIDHQLATYQPVVPSNGKQSVSSSNHPAKRAKPQRLSRFFSTSSHNEPDFMANAPSNSSGESNTIGTGQKDASLLTPKKFSKKVLRETTTSSSTGHKNVLTMLSTTASTSQRARNITISSTLPHHHSALYSFVINNTKQNETDLETFYAFAPPGMSALLNEEDLTAISQNIFTIMTSEQAQDRLHALGSKSVVNKTVYIPFTAVPTHSITAILQNCEQIKPAMPMKSQLSTQQATFLPQLANLEQSFQVYARKFATIPCTCALCHVLSLILQYNTTFYITYPVRAHQDDHQHIKTLDSIATLKNTIIERIRGLMKYHGTTLSKTTVTVYKFHYMWVLYYSTAHLRSADTVCKFTTKHGEPSRKMSELEANLSLFSAFHTNNDPNTLIFSPGVLPTPTLAELQANFDRFIPQSAQDKLKAQWQARAHEHLTTTWSYIKNEILPNVFNIEYLWEYIDYFFQLQLKIAQSTKKTRR